MRITDRENSGKWEDKLTAARAVHVELMFDTNLHYGIAFISLQSVHFVFSELVSSGC